MIRVALVVGHKWTSTGAYNAEMDISEFQYNHLLARSTERTMVMRSMRIHVIIVYRDHYRDLPAKINSANPDFIIRMHCNAFNQKASSTEFLYLERFRENRILSTMSTAKISPRAVLPSRGIKSKDTEDRGGYLLRYRDCESIQYNPPP